MEHDVPVYIRSADERFECVGSDVSRGMIDGRIDVVVGRSGVGTRSWLHSRVVRWDVLSIKSDEKVALREGAAYMWRNSVHPDDRCLYINCIYVKNVAKIIKDGCSKWAWKRPSWCFKLSINIGT